MTRFVVKVKPLQIDEFEITIEGTASDYPTAEQMALIAPHLTGIPNIKISDDISPCRAHHNRIFYRSQYLSGNDGLVVFPHLKSLRIYLCCASSVYDYADFTPARFPRVETVNIIMFDCRRRTMYSGRASVHPALSQCWPNASTVELYGVTTSSALYALLDHNPQITNLRVETSSHRTNNAQISRFSLADILKRLPMLDTLSIKLSTGERFYGNSENGADSNEDNDLLYIKNSRLKNIHIKHLTMTGECLEVLYMLPKLKDIAFMYCNLDNPEVALEKVKRIQKLNKTRKRGKYGASIGHIRFEYIKFKGYGYWPVKLAVAMVAAAPNIKKVTLEGDASELISAIRKRFPTITLFRLGHIRLMYRPGVLCH
ncbi:hypothetical protein GQ42DRAFT_44138 [Ramicandelaber brevisporus]|nr:hypothetical protein GQ42DRAFT_44138 [Ramicandelaber brevisporus]